MPRVARKSLESSFFHVIVQGISKEAIFKENCYKDSYKYLLKKYLHDKKIMIIAYCIMDNHTHILMYSDKVDDMIQLMREVNTSFAMLYNKSNDRVGYVFRDRYYTQTIKTEQQLFNCIAYIHNNPIKANITSNQQNYEYSSYKEYIGEKFFINDEGIKLVFGSSNNYMELFNEIHKKKEIYDIIDVKDKQHSQNIIEEFVREHKKSIELIMQNDNEFSELLLKLRHYGRHVFKRYVKGFQNK